MLFIVYIDIFADVKSVLFIIGARYKINDDYGQQAGSVGTFKYRVWRPLVIPSALQPACTSHTLFKRYSLP